MTVRHDQDGALEPVMLEAVDWLLRLKSGAATTDDALALERWRAQSPVHDAAFRDVAALRQMTLALPPRSAARPVLGRRAFLGGGGVAIAASVAGVMVVRPPLDLWPSLSDLMADHRTGPGERYAFAPTAGVNVEMNSRTSLSLIGGGDSVKILEGEAFVTVAGRASPFLVRLDGGHVAAQAASFNIRAFDGSLCVTCVEGELESQRGEQRTRLRAGEQLTYAGAGAARRIDVDPKLALAWRRGLLVFDGTPLSEVVAEINRYRAGRIILTKGAIGTRPVNGVFHTAQIENAVLQIRQLLGVQLTRLPGGVVLMG